MTTVPVRTRFAPSPTGFLHLGNARTALFSALAARRAGGRFMLRIEDTDQTRERADAREALFGDLAWLGLGWDEGPDVGGPHGPYLQTARAPRHAALLARLEAEGAAYPCFCTEDELERARAIQRAAGKPPRYAGTCRDLPTDEAAARKGQGRPASLRFRVPARRVVEFDDAVHGAQRFASADLGDFVVRRHDGTATFLFANAVDDAEMGVTLALRGEDHLANTPRQLLILEALSLPVPRYGHLPLVLGASGTPLSKRDGATSVGELREQGYLPSAVVNYLARLGHHGYPDGLLSLDELAGGFDLSHLGRAPAHFDMAQLAHFQKLAVHALGTDELLAWGARAGALEALVPAGDREAFASAVRGNVGAPAEVLRWAENLYRSDAPWSEDARAAVRAAGRGFFAAALAAAETAELDACAEAVRAATGAKGAALFKPLRAALTGELAGPELKTYWRLLAPARRKARLAWARDHAA
jgi:glutamyl-tRNA synthetase